MVNIAESIFDLNDLTSFTTFFSNYSFVINCGGPSSWESPTPYAISTLYFVHVNREQRTRITPVYKAI
jgi:hypothetical protein